MGPTHRGTGVLAAVAVSVAAGLGPASAAGLVAVAAATAGGQRWSPDADQGWLSWVPGGHRGLTHWWGIPAALGVLAWAVGGPVGVLVGGVAVGWGSHVVGDFVFGRASRRRPAGVPLAPWWSYAGLGLKVDGWVEWGVGVAVIPAATAWLVADYTGVLAILLP